MQNPSDLYSFDAGPDAGPEELMTDSAVLIVALGAIIDAGAVQRVLTEHLLETGDAKPVVTFDVDQLIDYRSRRPPMTFDTNTWASYETPKMLIQRLTDRDGRAYHLLSGPEPDFQWERVVIAIENLVYKLGVSLVVSVHGIPMGVPHTRPVGMTAHATRPDLIGNARSPFGRAQVPGSLGALLELRLGEAGHSAAGFAIHVPQYLAASEFAAGALSALNAVVDVTGLNLPNDDLVTRTEINRRAIDSEMEDNEEALAVVAAMEQQYDAFVEGQKYENLWADGTEIPSADQLGAEFENFLRTFTDDDKD